MIKNKNIKYIIVQTLLSSFVLVVFLCYIFNNNQVIDFLNKFNEIEQSARVITNLGIWLFLPILIVNTCLNLGVYVMISGIKLNKKVK